MLIIKNSFTRKYLAILIFDCKDPQNKMISKLVLTPQALGPHPPLWGWDWGFLIETRCWL